MTRDPAAAILAILLVLAVTAALIFHFGGRHGVVLIASVAFIARAARGVHLQIVGIENDAVAYDNFAIALAKYWVGEGPDPGSWLGKDGLPAILATVYSAIGHAPEVGFLINASAGALSVLVIAAVTAQMGWMSAVKPAAWLVALWPVAVLWGGALLREAIVTLLLAIGLWGAVRLYKLHIASGFVAIALSGLAMIFMRGGLAFLVLIGMPLTAAVVANLRGRTSPMKWLLAIVAGTAAFLAVAFLGEFFQSGRYFEYRAEVSADQNRGSSSFNAAGLGAGSIGLGPLAHALRVPLTGFGPWPWQVNNLSLALAAIDALLWIGVWFFAFYGMRSLSRRAEALLFMLPLAALIIALAANSSNFGLIIRLRGQGIVLIAPIAALGIALWLEKRKSHRAEKRLKPTSFAPRRSRAPSLN